jgi:hypothetical protein
MSALPLKADMRALPRDIRLVPQADSCTATKAPLFDYLVGAHEQRWRHLEAERLGGLHINDQLDLRGLMHRQIGGLLALEDSAGIGTDQTERVDGLPP